MYFQSSRIILRTSSKGLRLFLCALSLSFAANLSAAEGRAFSPYSGSAEALMQSADRFMKKLDARVQRDTVNQRSDESRDFFYVGYSVTLPPRPNQPFPEPNKVLLANVGVTVYKPYTTWAGQPVTSGPKAEGSSLANAFESVVELLDDDAAHGEAILQNNIPEDYRKSSLSARKPKDPRFNPETGLLNVPGSYFFYLVRDRLTIVAANVEVSVSKSRDYGEGLARPDLTALADAVLAGLSGAGGQAKVEVYPYAGLSASEKGLIPASARLPAKIVVSGAAAGEVVSFSLPPGAPGELRSAGAPAGTLAVPADSAGQAAVFYHYKPSGKPLSKPLDVAVTATYGGQTRTALVQVGLGLSFEALKGVLGQTYENNVHALGVTIKSLFHPQLNVASYLTNAEQAKVWGEGHVGMKLFTEWVNRPADAAHDDYYKGTANIVAGQDNKGFLVANQQPWYSPPGGKFFYPAVVLQSAGKHAYRLYGRGAVLSKDGTFLDYLDESMGRADSLLFLAKDDPESWYQSLACSLNATSETQYLMLEAVKLVPVYGAIADKASTVSSLVCGLMNGENEKSLIDLASWAGAQYLDKLMEPEVFNKLSKKLQNSVLAAKAATTGGTDNLKRKQDVDSLH